MGVSNNKTAEEFQEQEPGAITQDNSGMSQSQKNALKATLWSVVTLACAAGIAKILRS